MLSKQELVDRVGLDKKVVAKMEKEKEAVRKMLLAESKVISENDLENACDAIDFNIWETSKETDAVISTYEEAVEFVVSMICQDTIKDVYLDAIS